MGLGEWLADGREEKLPEHVGVWRQWSASFSVLPVAWVLLEGPIPQLCRQNLLE